MAAHIDGQTIQGTRLIGSGRTYDDARLANCTLKACMLAQFDDPEFGLVVRDSLLQGCRVDRCSIQGVLFERVTVDGLTAAQVHRLYGCVFNQVVLRGKIGPVMAMMPHSGLADRESHIAGMVAKYRDIEWALDISEASFSDADFYGVPGDLIRYDAGTQVLLRREKFSGATPEDLPPYVRTWVSRFDESPFDSLVGIAPKRSRSFAKYMHDIEWIHSQNLAG
ncbi:hypothetical protein [Streptomyces sp. CB03911]|uniref:hypothetical protein n=1 Tax=Streptomyces sp. CB03911 TaxID=1804758 RepID=UPI00093DEC79|nr:hypothetical protein [Streptomyces sp. CB03911]OKI30159.1 hypothetical protein A6A07_22945 [Streptomyces sp. CB03911]